MPRLKTTEIRKMKTEEIESRLQDLCSELIRLRSGAARGTLKKETGKIKPMRRTIAMVLTVLNERRKEINTIRRKSN
jgi:large subunit ribosomal protein L29